MAVLILSASDDIDLPDLLNKLGWIAENEPAPVGAATHNGDLLEQAIEEEFVVGFNYINAGGVLATRLFSPWELTEINPHTGSEASVLGFDHGKQAIRRFLLESISELTLQPAYVYREPEERG